MSHREHQPGDAPPLSAAEAAVERDVTLPADQAGRRLDQALAELLPEFSRSRLQVWIDAGLVLIEGAPARARTKVRGGERVRLRAVLESDERFAPEPIALSIVHEDADLLVIDKPAGLVVHPAAGNWNGTLQNGLLHYDPSLARLPRCGIVHRLDKDTTGLLVVAKSPGAHRSLVAQLQARSVRREYRALVVGEPVSGGCVDAPIGRHPTRRTSMAVIAGGRQAVTDYRILRAFRGYTLLAVTLQTGRTHQIRVHMAHIRHPLVGDPVYGGRPRPHKGLDPATAQALGRFPRQALHAIRLGLAHPTTGEAVSWEVPMAADMAALLQQLESTDAGT